MLECGSSAMTIKKKNILVTGIPGSGKTTLLDRAAEALKAFHPAGFITSEIRERGIRKGFELRGLDGQKGLLAHTDIRSPFRVGKYRVDVAGFESFLMALSLSGPATGLVIIDEIGKMEGLSGLFRHLLLQTFNSERIVLASIALKGGGFIDEIKRRGDVRLIEIDENHRNALTEEVIGEIRELVVQRKMKTLA